MMIHVLLCFVVSALSVPPPTGEENALVQLLGHVDEFVRGPVELTLKNNGLFVGYLEESKGAIGVVLSNRIEATGIVESEFAWDEISEVHFSTDIDWAEIEDLFEAGEFDVVLSILKRLFEKQYPFFQIMDDREIVRYMLLVEAYLEIEDHDEALSVSRVLKPYLIEEEGLLNLRRIEIQCFLNLGLLEEAHALSLLSIEAAAYPGQAGFAWIGLAGVLCLQGDYQEALQAAVHLFVFGPRDEDSVEEQTGAFLLAMLASSRLLLAEQCMRLHEEFLSIGLDPNQATIPKPLLRDWKSIDWSTFAKLPIQEEQKNSITLDSGKIPMIRIPLHSETHP